MIVADPRNPTALQLAAALRAHLPSPPADLVVVLGGDGFMLRTVADQGFAATYLGLNAGRIGFLMNDALDVVRVAADLAAGRYQVTAFAVLEVVLRFADGASQTLPAVNDVALERSTGQTAHLGLKVDGREVVAPLVADGLIVSTALGSTAYTFSAGGPACHPTLPLLAITAVAPHHPRLAPFLLPEQSEVVVDVIDRHRRPVRAVVDGNALDDVVGATVRIGADRVRLAWLPGHDFTTRMVTKILRP